MVCLPVCLCVLSACSSYQAETLRQVEQAGWSWQWIKTNRFDIAAAAHQADIALSDTLWVYLEGDGRAFIDPATPARDPTPHHPTALRMALAQPTDKQNPVSIVWLARPCQYSQPDHNRNCSRNDWTTGRYAPEIVTALNQAIDELKAQARAKHLVLVGYSGGGALAVLIAAERQTGPKDVNALITVAANLDLGYWTKRDGLSPLASSRDPADAAPMIATIAQIHFTGGDDRVTGTDVAQAYRSHVPSDAPIRIEEIPGFDHICCWAERWPDLLRTLSSTVNTR